MPRGKKISPEIIYKIMTSWAVTNNVNETAKRLDIPESTVRKTVKDNKDKAEFAKLCERKRSDFGKRADSIMHKALNRLEKELDNEDKDIPINHLTTVIGTLYDKKALADGNSTENVSVEIKLPHEVNEYAE